MSGISSGIGLISGIDRGALIDQLIAIESRPVDLLLARIRDIDSQRTAFLEVSAKLLGIQGAVNRFSKASLFNRFSTTSSNAGRLTAAATDTARPDAHTLRVLALASRHTVVSRGFADADSAGLPPGEITLESGRARVDAATDLNSLLGGKGIRRGVVTVTDRSGASVDVDLRGSVTVADVVDALNRASGVNIRAFVTGLESGGASGDRIVIEDETGLVTGRLVLADKSGFAAADLGLAQSVLASRIDGAKLVTLSVDATLASLNDGTGVDRRAKGVGDEISFRTSYGDFSVAFADALTPETDLKALNSGAGVRLGVIRITDRSKRTADVDLSSAQTVGDVIRAIDAAGVDVVASISNSGLTLRDAITTPAATAPALTVEDVTGFAASDLGVKGSAAAGELVGKSVFRIASIGDVIRAINFAPRNIGLVRASLSDDGLGIALTALGLDNRVEVKGASGSRFAADLGIDAAVFTSDQAFQSRRLIGGVNTTLLSSLNGGRGVTTGAVRLQDASGASTVIDFSTAQTLQDVIDLINADPTVAIKASINASGKGLALKNESTGSGSLGVADIQGTMAQQLGLIGGSAEIGSAIDGGNLQRKYISRQTLLTDLSPGSEVALGKFRITNSAGIGFEVSLSASHRTLGDVIDAISAAAPATVVARINDRGDGIMLEDNSGGTGSLTVLDLPGQRAAAFLRLAGTAKQGASFIDGSGETVIVVEPGDTLRGLANRMSASGAGVSASVVNNGAQGSPWSLAVTAASSGRRGEVLVDATSLGLSFESLVRAQDAAVLLGGEGGVLISSPTNTIDRAVEGVTFELVSAGAEDVAVVVAQDVGAIVETLRDFVDAYNEVQASLDDKTSFNQETLQRGLLLGDSTVNVIRTRLQRVASQSFSSAEPGLARLFAVGVRQTSNNRLTFDEAKFREAYAANPESVERLFTTEGAGVGSTLTSTIEGLTREFDGVITRKNETLAGQKENLNDRIASLNVSIAGKRARLEAQFVALETALAGLQRQQTALATLTRPAATR